MVLVVGLGRIVFMLFLFVIVFVFFLFVLIRLRAGGYWPGAHLGLTPRESQVLSLMVGGSSNRTIATELLVGEETVKSHVRGIYRKLAVTDRAAAVATALREGFFR